MPSLLLAAWFFPPAGGGGVQRSVRLVRGLAALGWRITVITAPEHAHPLRDDSLPRRLPPGLRVHRVEPLPPFPVRDSGARWVAPLAGRIHRLLRDEAFDVALATGSPFFPFLSLRATRHAGGPPVVLDFRDAWTVDPWHPLERGTLRSRVYAGVARAAERASLRAAVRSVFAVPAAFDSYREAYPELAPRMRLLTNGYDPADFPPADPPAPPGADGEIRISAAGTFADFRFPRLLLDALSDLRDRRPSLAARIRVELVGAGGEKLGTEAARAGLGAQVSIRGYLPHDSIPGILRGAHLLWFDNGPDRRVLSAKLFEYLAAGRPILAAAHPGGAAAALVREAEAGEVTSPEPAAVSRALESILDRLVAGPLPAPRPEVAARYSLPEQAAAWDRLLREAIAEGWP